MVRRDQRGGVGDVHPQPMTGGRFFQADSVVGILRARVVDGEGRQVGQVDPRLLRQIGEVYRGRRGGQVEATRVGHDGVIPMTEFEQRGVGVFRAFGAVERVEHAAAFRLTQRQHLHVV